MACITTCTHCGNCYESISEEDANDPNRLCLPCFDAASDHPYKCKCGLCKKWHALIPEEE